MYQFLTAFLVAPAMALSADITALPNDALNWATTPEGVGFAALNGDRFKESYMAMVTLPQGTISPPHIKSADMFGVVVSGEMTHVPTGTAPQDGTILGAGAYYHIPAGLAHISSCLSQQDCVTFLYQPGAFDFNVVNQ